MAIMKIHIDWQNLLQSTIAAKVLVIFGKENEAFFQLMWKDRLHEITCWDGTNFWLLFPENGSRDRLERVVFFVWHPEYVNRSKNPERGRVFDKQLTTVAQMAGISLTPEQQHFQETTSRLEMEKYAPDSRTREERCAVLHRRSPGKSAMGLVLKKNIFVNVHCDMCGFERRDVSPYFFKQDGREFYAAARALCPVCDDAHESSLAQGDHKPGLTRAMGRSYFLPDDTGLPWVVAREEWLCRDKSVTELDSHWREVNARVEDQGPALERAAKIISGDFAPAGETPTSTKARSQALALQGDLILFTGDVLDDPDLPIPKMVAGSEVYLRRNKRKRSD